MVFRNGRGYIHGCAGAILNQWQIISAAHCFKEHDYLEDPALWRVIPKFTRIVIPPNCTPECNPDEWTTPGISFWIFDKKWFIGCFN